MSYVTKTSLEEAQRAVLEEAASNPRLTKQGQIDTARMLSSLIGEVQVTYHTAHCVGLYGNYRVETDLGFVLGKGRTVREAWEKAHGWTGVACLL